MLREMGSLCFFLTCRTFLLTTYRTLPYLVVMQDELIRKAMRELAARRWAKATDADRAEAARKMVAGQRKARRNRKAKGEAK